MIPFAPDVLQLVTFCARSSAMSAIDTGRIEVDSKMVVLRPNRIAQEVAKKHTGALQSVWASQEKRIQAALKIQTHARGLLSRRKGRDKESRSGAVVRHRRPSVKAMPPQRRRSSAGKLPV
jgi:hypothetical protein